MIVSIIVINPLAKYISLDGFLVQEAKVLFLVVFELDMK